MGARGAGPVTDARRRDRNGRQLPCAGVPVGAHSVPKPLQHTLNGGWKAYGRCVQCGVYVLSNGAGWERELDEREVALLAVAR